MRRRSDNEENRIRCSSITKVRVKDRHTDELYSKLRNCFQLNVHPPTKNSVLLEAEAKTLLYDRACPTNEVVFETIVSSPLTLG